MPRTIARTPSEPTEKIVGQVVFAAFGILCVAIVASWIYLLAAVLGLVGTLTIQQVFLAFGMTIVIGCVALWAAAQIDLIAISETIERFIWTTLVAAILSAGGAAVVAELKSTAPAAQSAQAH
jgi:hypothetical protein